MNRIDMRECIRESRKKLTAQTERQWPTYSHAYTIIQIDSDVKVTSRTCIQ